MKPQHNTPTKDNCISPKNNHQHLRNTMNSSHTPRGIRNNNPLNIRLGKSQWLGAVPESEQTDRSFVQFTEMRYGFRAALVLIRNYQEKHHLYTIEGIVSRWAPPQENQTEEYIRFVCRKTGIGGRENLPVGDPRIKEVVWAMAQMECGTEVLAYREALEEA